MLKFLMQNLQVREQSTANEHVYITSQFMALNLPVSLLSTMDFQPDSTWKSSEPRDSTCGSSTLSTRCEVADRNRRVHLSMVGPACVSRRSWVGVLAKEWQVQQVQSCKKQIASISAVPENFQHQ